MYFSPNSLEHLRLKWFIHIKGFYLWNVVLLISKVLSMNQTYMIKIYD